MRKNICTLILSLLGVSGLLITESVPVYAKPNKVTVQKVTPAPASNAANAIISGDRVALVIGNAAYLHSPLGNPVNDATDVAEKLRGLGFDVVAHNNVKIKDIGSILNEFGSKLKPGSVALVFYAGHGLQIKGENYFPAVDAEINSEVDVSNQSISAKQIMDLLEDSKTRLNLVFLDACRNNPYARSFRSAANGLAKVVAPAGTLISYATRPGSTAADGEGHNGLYTSKLLKQFESSQPIELALKAVVSEVKADSRGKQEPWMEGSIEGEFCFKVCMSGNQQPAPAVDPASVELSFWNSIKDSKNPADFQIYLATYPNGKFAGVALNRLNPSTTVAGRQSFEPEMVKLPNGTWMGKYEVTKAQFAAFVSETNYQTEAEKGDGCESGSPETEWKIGRVKEYNWRNLGFAQKDNYPVVCVSWNDVQQYLEWLNEKTGKVYRLPTADEWFKACQAGKTTKYCGSDDIETVAWYWSNANDRNHSVGQKQPNAWGLYDMSGNVSEWTNSCYKAECAYRVLSGASWINSDKDALSITTLGTYNYPNYISIWLSFRLMLTK